MGFGIDPLVIPIDSMYISSCIDDDDVGFPERMSANDTILITNDFYTGQHFSKYHLCPEYSFEHFGQVGNGPDDILMGTTGQISGDAYYVMNDQIGLIAKYPLAQIKRSPNNDNLQVIMKYTLPDVQISKLSPVNDSTFFMLGVVDEKFHYCLFNSQNKILDKESNIYNFNDVELNRYHKFLSNQGKLIKHPTEPKYAATTAYSGNIDFISIENDSIRMVCENHNRNPQLKPECIGDAFRMVPDENAPIGFIDVAANMDYVFALYSPHNFSNGHKSKTLLVYDWNGKPIAILEMPKDVYSLAANSDYLFFSTTNDTAGYTIKQLNLNYLYSMLKSKSN